MHVSLFSSEPSKHDKWRNVLHDQFQLDHTHVFLPPVALTQQISPMPIESLSQISPLPPHSPPIESPLMPHLSPPLLSPPTQLRSIKPIQYRNGVRLFECLYKILDQGGRCCLQWTNKAEGVFVIINRDILCFIWNQLKKTNVKFNNLLRQMRFDFLF